MINIPYPKITARDPVGQVAELKSYLHQLVDQLNYQLRELEKNQDKEGKR